jgi:hypothetical protein
MLRYHDDYRRCEDGWRFVRRVMLFDMEVTVDLPARVARSPYPADVFPLAG